MSASVALAASCGGAGPQTERPQLHMDVQVSPSPPRVGDTQLAFELTDSEGQPVTGASLRVEGTMSHAGMVPEFADAAEVAPGRYEATLEFTMGGDWILLVDATTADARAHHWQEDVNNVSSARRDGD